MIVFICARNYCTAPTKHKIGQDWSYGVITETDAQGLPSFFFRGKQHHLFVG